MPTYEYRCNSCAHEFEAFQSMTEEKIKICPRCGEDRVERLISSGSGLIFKGSGFYITDYRKDSYKRDAGKDAGVASPGKSKTTNDSSGKPKTADTSSGKSSDASSTKPAPKKSAD